MGGAIGSASVVVNVAESTVAFQLTAPISGVAAQQQFGCTMTNCSYVNGSEPLVETFLLCFRLLTSLQVENYPVTYACSAITCRCYPGAYVCGNGAKLGARVIRPSVLNTMQI